MSTLPPRPLARYGCFLPYKVRERSTANDVEHVLISKSLGVSTVFPVIASYRALEECTRATGPLTTDASVALESLQQAGAIASPLGFVFRRLSASAPPIFSSELDAARVAKAQISIQTLQMWFVYWMVFAVFHLLEQVFMLRYFVPFYGLMKILLCVWLMWPIVFFSALSPPSAQLLQQEWELFSKNGAGKVYYEYIAPTLDGNIGTVRAGELSEHAAHACQKLLALAAYAFGNGSSDRLEKDKQNLLTWGRQLFDYVASFSRTDSNRAHDDAAKLNIGVDQGIIDASYVMVKNATTTSMDTDENSAAQFDSFAPENDEQEQAGPRFRASRSLWW